MGRLNRWLMKRAKKKMEEMEKDMDEVFKDF